MVTTEPPSTTVPKAPAAAEAEAAAAGTPLAEPGPCAITYGNCEATRCCQDPGTRCYKRDADWYECRESCPNDDTWACARASGAAAGPLAGSKTPATTPAATPATTATLRPGAAASVSRMNASKVAAVSKLKAAPEADQGPKPSLYCFSLMLPSGAELSLLRTQLERGAGIFKCNWWNVYSNQSVELTPGPPVRILAEVIPGSLQCNFGGEYNTAMNSEIFYRVWQRVIDDGRYLLYDWTVKLDPDAVFLPERLRSHVGQRNPNDPVYINNCDEGLHGPIEAISHGGMKTFGMGLQRCHDSLEHEWMTYGEDVWLRRCLGMLEVQRQDDYAVLRERACRPYEWPIPCTSGAVSFHPLKTPKEYFECLGQAQR